MVREIQALCHFGKDNDKIKARKWDSIEQGEHSSALIDEVTSRSIVSFSKRSQEEEPPKLQMEYLMLHIQKHHDKKSSRKEKNIVLTIVYNFGFAIKQQWDFCIFFVTRALVGVDNHTTLLRNGECFSI